MTNLSDFLKVKQVRCVDDDGCNDLTIGKEYEVTRLSLAVHIIDDDDGEYSYQARRFEPVLDPAENPIQNAELTPEFEAVEPKFKVGDPVYWGLKSRIFKVFRLMTANVLEVELDDVVTAVHKDELCPATLENYGKLCSLFERIDFEAPPLTGNELCRKLLDKGERYIMAKDDTDTWRIICDYCDDWFTDVVTGKCLKNVTPVNSKGEPLTESILND